MRIQAGRQQRWIFDLPTGAAVMSLLVGQLIAAAIIASVVISAMWLGYQFLAAAALFVLFFIFT